MAWCRSKAEAEADERAAAASRTGADASSPAAVHIITFRAGAIDFKHASRLSLSDDAKRVTYFFSKRREFTKNVLLRSTVIWPWPIMLLLLRDYASPDYAKWTILERDYATYYASVIRYATRAPSHFLGGLC